MSSKFQAIFVPATDQQFAEWHVVEWVTEKSGDARSVILTRFGDCSGALAREEAGLLQEAYNRDFYRNFG